MREGTIKYYNEDRGFGHITVRGSPDVFFHIKNMREVRGAGPCATFGRRVVANSLPRKGDKVYFRQEMSHRGPKAQAWGFVPQLLPTLQDMRDTIHSAKAGDKLKLTFATKTFNGDLKGRLMMLIAMNGNSFTITTNGALYNLLSVANSGAWSGFNTYTITLLDAFDPDYFIRRTIGRDLLEDITFVE